MSLHAWSWLFLSLYVVLMIGIGFIGNKRVKNADDFATARQSYGPIFLAFAVAATTASGGTFVGFPAIAFDAGLAAMWSGMLYPAGVYLGVLICLKFVSNNGNEFGSRSIPEFLGMRYQSDVIRIFVSLFSLLLFFYLSGQLVSGIVMFQVMLGVPAAWALGITATVLMVYIVLGGAHADILTDGIQGFIMVLIAMGIGLIFVMGYGVDGGFSAMIGELEKQDENLVKWLNPDSPLYHSWWSVSAIVISHIPLGLLPHIGNKLWALEHPNDQRRFIGFACIFGLTLGMLGLGGVLARVVIGDALLEQGLSTNNALPLLFLEIFPPWFAAFLGIAILSAVMSTADGLVVSSSQIIANDLYRCTFVPRYRGHLDKATLDRRELNISRLSTVAVMLICTMMAWVLMDRNVALIAWVGTGGLMAGFAGPLVLGAVWPGVTRAGALAGLVAGVSAFSVLHGGIIDPSWFSSAPLAHAAQWLQGEAPNPFSCAAMGEIVSVTCTWVVSLFTRPLPQSYVRQLFPDRRGGGVVEH